MENIFILTDTRRLTTDPTDRMCAPRVHISVYETQPAMKCYSVQRNEMREISASTGTIISSVSPKLNKSIQHESVSRLSAENCCSRMNILSLQGEMSNVMELPALTLTCCYCLGCNLVQIIKTCFYPQWVHLHDFPVCASGGFTSQLLH